VTPRPSIVRVSRPSSTSAVGCGLEVFAEDADRQVVDGEGAFAAQANLFVPN
jgi:hypothetical protein